MDQVRVGLDDERYFLTLNGLWRGRNGPFQPAFVIRNTNFRNDGRLNLTDVASLEVETRQFASRRLEKGDVLVERSGGGPTQPVGRVCYVDVDDSTPFSFSNFTSVIRIRDKSVFDPRYVHLYLLALYHSGYTIPLQRATTGIRNLDWNAYLGTKLPLLPRDVQTRIADAPLSVLRSLELQEGLLNLLAAVKQAAMHQVFTRGLRNEPQIETDYGLLPQSWPTTALGECCEVQSGVTKGRVIPADEAIEVPYLRVANVQDGHLDLREIKTIAIRRSELSRYLLRHGDVLLTEGGDLDKLGRGFIWRDEISNCIHQNHIFAVRPATERLLPEFLAYLVQSSYGKAYFLSVAHKTTNLATINSTKLKALPVPLPHLAEQREIVSMLDVIDRSLHLHQRKLGVLRELFDVLLHELMTGRVRVSEPDLETGGRATTKSMQFS